MNFLVKVDCALAVTLNTFADTFLHVSSISCNDYSTLGIISHLFFATPRSPKGNDTASKHISIPSYSYDPPSLWLHSVLLSQTGCSPLPSSFSSALMQLRFNFLSDMCLVTLLGSKASPWNGSWVLSPSKRVQTRKNCRCDQVKESKVLVGKSTRLLFTFASHKIHKESQLTRRKVCLHSTNPRF